MTDSMEAVSTTREGSYFIYVAIALVAVLMISNTVATKLIAIGPLVLTGAIFLFPFSYIFGDILTEVYGYRASRKIIWSGFVALAFMSLMYWIVGMLPPAVFWMNQDAYSAILGVVPRIVLGSMLGYFAGEFCNSYVLSRMKIWTGGKHLWARTIGSTVVGEGVDTVVFVLVAFAGLVPGSVLLSLMVSAYFVKVGIEVLLTPVTYKVVRFLKRAEGVDTFDHGVNYNPFAVRS